MGLVLPPQLQISAAAARLLAKCLLAVLVVAALVGLGWAGGSRYWRAQYKDVVTEQAGVLADLAAKTKVAKEATDRAIADYKSKDKARTAAHDKAVSDAYERGKAVGRAVGAGERRLRPDWAVCPARPTPGGPAPAGGGDPAELGRRAVAIGRILGQAGVWDADYKRVYDALIDTRALLAQCYGTTPDG